MPPGVTKADTSHSHPNTARLEIPTSSGFSVAAGETAASKGKRPPYADRQSGRLGPVPTQADASDAAETIRAVLAAVESGELVADNPRAVALVRRLEGALIALEALGNRSE